MKRVCIIGCGSIGSLYAAHLARVAEVWAFVRRADHARALNEYGLRVSGTHEFHSNVRASNDPSALPQFDFGIVSCKATQTREAVSPVAHLFKNGAILSSQNGLGSEEVIAGIAKTFVMRGTTFMSGSRVTDTHVRYELDTATWMGPFEPAKTPFSLVQEAAALINSSGLKAVALEDARPAQWSKLIFNSSVNAVAALTELPHSYHYAEEKEFSDLGHLLHALIEEGKKVAEGLGVKLYEDPWEMNKLGAQTDHPPSMLYDTRHKLQTEVEFLGGAIAREAQRAGIPALLHTALYQLIKGKEASWNYDGKERAVAK
ncbi:MAG TPA: ketopantoate reductase family protein [Candidatus Acidoferrum sp.]|jgi:2-dehydropantoate 2-reductase|nr:ketopantoate reductase family protein [Candidatus Acidoferrum sp.]